MHGKGRVFYTSMGHREDVWTSPVFQNILIGGIAWALGDAKADATPNLAQVAPKWSENPPFRRPRRLRLQRLRRLPPNRKRRPVPIKLDAFLELRRPQFRGFPRARRCIATGCRRMRWRSSAKSLKSWLGCQDSNL